jgi:hypothetical protein
MRPASFETAAFGGLLRMRSVSKSIDNRRNLG